MLGVFHGPVELNILPAPHRVRRTLIFACCYSIIDQRHDFDVAIDILSARRFPLLDLVTHTFSLERAQDALGTAYDKSTGAIKVQLVF